METSNQLAATGNDRETNGVQAKMLLCPGHGIEDWRSRKARDMGRRVRPSLKQSGGSVDGGGGGRVGWLGRGGRLGCPENFMQQNGCVGSRSRKGTVLTLGISMDCRSAGGRILSGGELQPGERLS
ncbi:hypothetical protein GX51_06667 [Blastomyces parvus]|uniref:Uncharacterized protein n=1 Tax=Blastomyces parvus TaxID=2060905 RepID=A0A2B7WQ74_9EURO|nr:hypothetical protein GX51_06667 [Blastomyces parvus]